jgi:hypothetical protein
MDATLIETHKRSAFVWLQGVQGLPAVELLMVRKGNDAYAEFRDGNVPAGHPQLRVLQASLGRLPVSVTKVSLRSDTAGYQEDLLSCCGKGKDEPFGVIDFAVGADPTEAFRAPVLATSETGWKPLVRGVRRQAAGSGMGRDLPRAQRGRA